MLKRIEIKNVALIQEVSLELTEGLNILTGETGAGKSILIDAISLVLGERADRELIKTGAEKASVEVAFLANDPRVSKTLSELAIEESEEILLSRELTASGRNVCRINGTLVNNAALQRVSADLIDIHGQHEHQSLLNARLHLGLLDAYAQKDVGERKQAVADELQKARKIKRQIEELGGIGGERERRMDILQFQIREITEAKIQAGEEDALTSEHNMLTNAEKIAMALEESYERLYGSDSSNAMAQISESMRQMQRIAEYDPAYQDILDKITENYYSLEATVQDIRSANASFYFDPQRLASVENRLDELSGIKKKYGGSLERVLEYLAECETELDRLTHAEERLTALQTEYNALVDALYIDCMALHQARQKAAERFSKEVCAQLSDLGMGRANFSVAFAPLPQREEIENDLEKFHSDGLDRVEFMLCANPGESQKPLSKVASGGEASRIMLALKTIAADLDGIDCLIFDEIDTGISGNMAHIVAQKMAEISRSRQVICITHLAQLACMADTHFMIEKQSTQERTTTRVHRIDGAERIREIARLLGGEGAGGHGTAHARELIDQAEAYKKKL